MSFKADSNFQLIENVLNNYFAWIFVLISLQDYLKVNLIEPILFMFVQRILSEKGPCCKQITFTKTTFF